VVLRSEKKQRVASSAANEIPLATALQLVRGLAFPSVLELLILSFLPTLALEALALLSKACLKLVKEHLTTCARSTSTSCWSSH
jgi:hypothetical protein